MSTKLKIKFSVQTKHEPFFSGGKIAFTGDGQYFICNTGEDLCVVDVETGSITKKINQEEDLINVFAVGQKDIVCSHKSGLLRQWNWQEGKITRTWKSFHHGPVSVLSFDSTANLVASGGTDGLLKVWDLSKQYCTHSLRGAQGVFSVVKFNPDEQRGLIYGSAADLKISVWSLQTSELVASLEGHYSVVTDIAFTDDGMTLISSSRDKVVIIWDAVTHESRRVIPVFEAVESILLLPQGNLVKMLGIEDNEPYFITAGDKGVLRLWRLSNGQQVYSQQASLLHSEENPQVITQILVSDDWARVVIVTSDHNIIVYLLNGLLMQKQFSGYNDEILDVVFFGSKESRVAMATNSPDIKVYELSTMNCHLLKGHSDHVLSLSVPRTNRDLLVSASKDNTIRVWLYDQVLQSISCISTGSGHTSAVGCVSWSLMGTRFLVSGSQDHCVKKWNTANILSESKHSSPVPTLTVLNTEIAHEKDINSVCVAPNDSLVATASQDKTAKLWNSDLKLVGVLRGHRRGVWCVQFSPTDQVLATSSADSTVKLWSLTDNSCIRTFEGHNSSVLRVYFLSRGMQLLTSASDGLLKLWTIKNNECVNTFDEHEGRVWALAVNHQQTLVISGAADSTFIVWKDVTEEEALAVAVKKDEFILQEQTLMNLLKDKNYLKALELAITLDQPFRALNILKELNMEGSDSLRDTILKLRDDQRDAILNFAVTWNTNSRHCHEAQSILKILLANLSPEKLLSTINITSSLEGLLPYTERHFSRANRMLQHVSLLDYMAVRMRITGKIESTSTSLSVPEMEFFFDNIGNKKINPNIKRESNPEELVENFEEFEPIAAPSGSDDEETDGSNSSAFPDSDNKFMDHSENIVKPVLDYDQSENRIETTVENSESESIDDFVNEHEHLDFKRKSTKTKPVERPKKITPVVGHDPRDEIIPDDSVNNNLHLGENLPQKKIVKLKENITNVKNIHIHANKRQKHIYGNKKLHFKAVNFKSKAIVKRRILKKRKISK